MIITETTPGQEYSVKCRKKRGNASARLGGCWQTAEIHAVWETDSVQSVLLESLSKKENENKQSDCKIYSYFIYFFSHPCTQSVITPRPSGIQINKPPSQAHKISAHMLIALVLSNLLNFGAQIFLLVNLIPSLKYLKKRVFHPDFLGATRRRSSGFVSLPYRFLQPEVSE